MTRSSVTRGQNTLEVSKKQPGAVKFEQKPSVTQGRRDGVNFGRKRAASRVTQFMNEPYINTSLLQSEARAAKSLLLAVHSGAACVDPIRL